MTLVLRTLLVIALVGFVAWIGAELVRAPEDDSPIVSDPQKPGSKWVGELAAPRGAGPFPAVIVLHGCDGIASHSRGWARRVASWGYATFLIDSYTRRNQTNICEDTDVVPIAARAQDIAQGADYLRTLPSIDPKRIGAVGLSHGGSAALHAARRNGNGRASRAALQAVVAFYPWCPRNAAPLATDVLILIGDADDWTPSRRCVDLAARSEKTAGRRPVLKVYPDATHAFEVRAPNRLDFGHMEKFHPDAAVDAFALTRQFLDQRLRK